MQRMTLDQLIAALTKLREEKPHLAEMEVYCEDAEMGVAFGNSILGVTSDEEGTNLRVTQD